MFMAVSARIRSAQSLFNALRALLLPAALLSAAPVLAQTPTCVTPPVGAALWSNGANWPGGVVPGPGSCVTIPSGTTMYLDVTSTAALAELEIVGSLIVPCGTHTLQASNILVTGSLIAGSQAAPYSGGFTIRLLQGPLCNPSKEEQTLAVESGGLLQLAGIPFTPSWTRLALTAPAAPGAVTQRIDLQSTVSWLANQEVVIASTDYDQNQCEKRTIYSLGGTSIKVNNGLIYPHWGATEGLAYDPIGIEERAEVGLLSRSIVIEGTPYVTPGGVTSAGHVVLRNASTSTPRAELSWVEFKNLGKEGVLGKYPMHFHQISAASGSFVRNCSFNKSYNRAISIHTTQGVDVSDNVAFDIIGHAYYFEDDPAQGCTMNRNLGLLTKPGTVIPSDSKPATFWLHSPNNTVQQNAAAGSSDYGFWFETNSGDPSPWGPGQLFENVAHSNGRSGFFLDETRPKPVPESIYDGCVAYKNREYGIWLRSYSESRVTNARVADNRAGFYLASEGFQWPIPDYLINGSLFGISRTRLQSSLVIGETSNVGVPTTCDELAVGRSLPQTIPFVDGLNLPKWHALTGVEFYDGLVGVEDTKFAEFRPQSVATPLCGGSTSFDRQAGALAQVRYNNPWAIDPRNYVSNVSFVNSGSTVTNEVWFRTPNGLFTVCPSPGVLVDDGAISNTVIHDVDGSLTGAAGASVFPQNLFLSPDLPSTAPGSGSIVNGSWNARITLDPSGQVGPPTAPYAQFELIDLNLYFAKPASAVEGIGVYSWNRGQWFLKTDPVQFACQPTQYRLDRFSLNLLTDEIYEVVYDPGLTPSQWPSAVAASVQFTEAGRWVYIVLPLVPPGAGQSLLVQVDNINLSSAIDIPSLYAGPGNEYFLEASANKLHAKILVLGTGTGINSGARTTLLALVL